MQPLLLPVVKAVISQRTKAHRSLYHVWNITRKTNKSLFRRITLHTICKAGDNAHWTNRTGWGWENKITVPEAQDMAGCSSVTVGRRTPLKNRLYALYVRIHTHPEHSIFTTPVASNAAFVYSSWGAATPTHKSVNMWIWGQPEKQNLNK